MSKEKQVVYVISCGTPNTEQLYEIIPLFQSVHLEVCVILTPFATKFVDKERLTRLARYPVRSEYKKPGDPDTLPPADAIVVFPATFNTINKWALGISDTLALGLLCEFTGMRLPILAVPVVRKGKLAEHPAFHRSLEMLEGYGVHIFYKPEIYPPRNEVPSQILLNELQKMMQSPK